MPRKSLLRVGRNQSAVRASGAARAWAPCSNGLYYASPGQIAMFVDTRHCDMPTIPGTARLLAIIDLQNAIAGAELSLDTVLRVVVERAAELTDASGGVVELVEGTDMVYRAASGTAAGSVGVRLRRDSSLSGLCVAEGIPLCSDDTESDPRVDREACRRVGIASMICVPLFHGGDAVGVLKVLSKRTAAFDAEDIATLELLARIVATVMHQARAHEAALHLSLHDELTGLSNRRAFEARLLQEFDRYRRYQRPLSLVVVDLDGFKRLNDSSGHAAGDHALREIASLLKNAMRVSDDCFRIGGDEFAIILPDTPREGAVRVVDRIRATVAAAALGDGTVGFSAGIVQADGISSAEFTAAADAALYEEKRGKDSVLAR